MGCTRVFLRQVLNQFISGKSASRLNEPAESSESTDHGGSIHPLLLQRQQTGAGFTLRQLATGWIQQQGDVVKPWRLTVQGVVNASLGGQGLAKILSADHIGDPEAKFIDHRCQLIGNEAIGTAQHHITAAMRVVRPTLSRQLGSR